MSGEQIQAGLHDVALTNMAVFGAILAPIGLSSLFSSRYAETVSVAFH
jgi:hypothetical protein